MTTPPRPPQRQLGWPKGVPRRPVCTPEQWIAQAKFEAQEAGVPLRGVLGASNSRLHFEVRWKAFRALVGAGFSACSIGKASGFDESSIIYAYRSVYRQRKLDRCRRAKQPKLEAAE